MEMIIIGGLLVAIAVLALAIILLLANLNAWFMKVAEGTTAFTNTGDSLKDIFPHVIGYKMSDTKDSEGRNWLIPGVERKEWYQDLLWKSLKIRFIGLLWPHAHRHTFNIRSRKRLLEGANVESGVSLKARVVDSPEGTVVDSLLFLVPRPVYLDGVQLAGDNSRINLLLLPIYRQVIPISPVYHLKGDFFTQLDAALESAVVDFFATHREEGDVPLTYAHWLKLAKSGGNSPLERHLHSLNVSKKYRDSLGSGGELVKYIDDMTQGSLTDEVPGRAGEIAPLGIIPRFGFALVSFRIIDWEPHQDTKDLAKALLAQETERHTADGVRQKALGERDAILERATAESSRYVQLVNALVSKGVHPDVAAQVMATQLRTENIRDGKVTTYVEGAASATIMVPTSSANPTQ